MKKNILLFLLIFSSFNFAYSNNFEIFPMIYNLHTVKTLGNNVVAFGNTGYAMLSNDEGENWSQIKVNNSDYIVNIFAENNTLLSFGNKGDICITNLADSTTITVKKLDDSILAVIQYPDGYFVRAADRIFTLNNNFEIEHSSELVSSDLSEEAEVGELADFNRSIAYFKEHFVLELDSAYFVRYDKNLNLVDTLSVLSAGLFSRITKFSNWIESDDNYLYFRIVAASVKGVWQSYLFQTENFEDIENVKTISNGKGVYHIYDNKAYYLDKYSNRLRDSITFTQRGSWWGLQFKDFTVVKNKQIIVGNDKTIRILDLQDSTLIVRSDAYGFSNIELGPTPLVLHNNEILIQAYSDLPYLWKSVDGGITFRPTIKRLEDETDNLIFIQNKFKARYYDTLNKKIYFFGAGINSNEIFMTDESCESFTTLPNKVSVYMSNRTLININDDYLIVCGGPRKIPWLDPNKIYNDINILDKELNVLNFMIDSSAGAIDYIYSLDTNSFIVHCTNITDGTSEIRYTLDKSTEIWETIYKYENNQTFLFNTEIWSKGKRYLALVHNEINTTNKEKTAVYLDVLDLASKEFHRVKEWYPDEYSKEHEFGVYDVGMALFSDENYVYVSFQDTLYYVSDILDKSSWAYHNLPNKDAKIFAHAVKYGDAIIGRYFNYPLNNHLHRIKPLDPIPTSIESKIEAMNYLFSYPPYPMPATNEVRSLIYWDTSIDIDEKNIAVYNIYGEKVSTEEQIKIDRLTGYSGNLVWDCSGVPAGVYLINIKHGTQNQTIKAIVAK